MSFEYIPDEFKPAKTGITLYTMGSHNGALPSVILSVLGVPYTPKFINLIEGVHRSPWFKQLNPNGQIPVMIEMTSSGPIVMAESGAIVEYILEKYDPTGKLTFPKDSPEHVEALQWAHFRDSTLMPMQSMSNYFSFLAPTKNPEALQFFKTYTNSKFKLLQTQIENNGSEHVVGNRLSYVDLLYIPNITFAFMAGFDIHKDFPELAKWTNKILAVPGVVRGLNVTNKNLCFVKGPWKEPQISAKY